MGRIKLHVCWVVAGLVAPCTALAQSPLTNPGGRVAPYGTYRITPNILADGQVANLLLDSHNNLMVDCAVGCVSGGGSVGSVAVPDIAGANATSTAPSYTAGGQPLSMDLSGNLRVTLGGVSVSLGAGSAAIGSVTVSSTAAPAQQTPVGDAAVSVPAATSTLVWTTSAAARVLRIVPAITTCMMRADSTASANATSTPIPGGYVWNLIEPPPNASVYVYCPTATVVAVSQGN